MKPGIRTQVFERAKELGVQVETSKGNRNFEVLARPPNGKKFSTGEHELVCSAWDREKADDCWKDMLERLEQSEVVECEDDCECKE
jgi:heme-degrading monooxygenase HmoA